MTAPPSDVPKVHVLDNGLRVVVDRRAGFPVAAVALWFDAGCADETEHERGAAHFVEHLLFKGTPTYGLGCGADAIERQGGHLNAWTAWDDMCIHASVPVEGLETTVDVILDMASNSLFDADEIDNERAVVIEEIRSYDDDPFSVIDDRLQADVFGEHPYGYPILGTPASVANLSRDTLVGFWRRNYHPGRATLVVVGDVDPSSLLGRVEQSTASWPVGAARVSPPSAGARVGGAVRIQRRFQTNAAVAAGRGPAWDDPSTPAFAVLMAALGQGSGSLLRQRVERDAAAATDTFAAHSAMRWDGIWSAGASGGDTVRASATLRCVLDEVAAGDVPGEAVAQAQALILADLRFAKQTVDAESHDLAWSVSRCGAPDFARRYRSAIAAVTLDDVRHAAHRWLASADRCWAWLDDSASPDVMSTALHAPRAPLAPKSTRSPTVWIQPSRSELATLHVRIPGGRQIETRGRAGIARFWSELISRGPADVTFKAFTRDCDRWGVQFSAGSERSATWISVSAPAESATFAAEQLVRTLENPRFAARDVEDVRREALDEVDFAEDSGDAVAGRRLARSLWGNHPWGTPAIGTRSSLRTLTPAALARFHRQNFGCQRPVVVALGDVGASQIHELLDRIASHAATSAVAALPRPEALAAPRSHRLVRDHHQATVVMGTQGFAIDDAKRMSALLAAAILDGMSGRLFMELRERHGLAYSVWAHSAHAVGGGPFAAGLATDPSRAPEALKRLRGELEGLAESGPTDAELDKARRMMLGSQVIALQRLQTQADVMARARAYGLPATTDDLRAELWAPTPRDVRQTMTTLLDRAWVDVRVIPRQKRP